MASKKRKAPAPPSRTGIVADAFKRDVREQCQRKVSTNSTESGVSLSLSTGSIALQPKKTRAPAPPKNSQRANFKKQALIMREDTTVDVESVGSGCESAAVAVLDQLIECLDNQEYSDQLSECSDLYPTFSEGHQPPHQPDDGKHFRDDILQEDISDVTPERDVENRETEKGDEDNLKHFTDDTQEATSKMKNSKLEVDEDNLDVDNLMSIEVDNTLPYSNTCDLPVAVYLPNNEIKPNEINKDIFCVNNEECVSANSVFSISNQNGSFSRNDKESSDTECSNTIHAISTKEQYSYDKANTKDENKTFNKPWQTPRYVSQNNVAAITISINDPSSPPPLSISDHDDVNFEGISLPEFDTEEIGIEEIVVKSGEDKVNDERESQTWTREESNNNLSNKRYEEVTCEEDISKHDENENICIPEKCDEDTIVGDRIGENGESWRTLPMVNWKTDDVVAWCRAKQLNDCVEPLKAYNITGESILQLTEKDLVKIGVSDTEVHEQFFMEMEKLIDVPVPKEKSMWRLQQASIRRKHLQTKSETLSHELENLQKLSDVQDHMISQSMIKLREDQRRASILLSSFGEADIHRINRQHPAVALRRSSSLEEDRSLSWAGGGTHKNLEKWTNYDVIHWLQSEGLHRFIPCFRGKRITGHHLKNIDSKFLDDIQVRSTADREHLLSTIYKLEHPEEHLSFENIHHTLAVKEDQEGSSFDLESLESNIEASQTSDGPKNIVVGQIINKECKTGVNAECRSQDIKSDIKRRKHGLKILKEKLTPRKPSSSHAKYTVHVWHQCIATISGLQKCSVKVQESTSCDEIIKMVLEKCSSIDDSHKYQLVQESIPADNSRVLGKYECPINLQRHCKKSDHKLILRKINGKEIKVISKLQDATSEAEHIWVSLTSTITDVLELSLRRFGIKDSHSSHFHLQTGNDAKYGEHCEEDSVISSYACDTFLLCRNLDDHTKQRHTPPRLVERNTSVLSKASSLSTWSETTSSEHSSHPDVLAESVAVEKLQHLEDQMASIEMSLTVPRDTKPERPPDLPPLDLNFLVTPKAPPQPLREDATQTTPLVENNVQKLTPQKVELLQEIAIMKNSLDERDEYIFHLKDQLDKLRTLEKHNETLSFYDVVVQFDSPTMLLPMEVTPSKEGVPFTTVTNDNNHLEVDYITPYSGLHIGDRIIEVNGHTMLQSTDQEIYKKTVNEMHTGVMRMLIGRYSDTNQPTDLHDISELSSLKEDLALVHMELEAMTLDNDALKAENERLKLDKQNLIDTNRSVASDLAHLQDKQDSLENAWTQLRATLVDIKNIPDLDSTHYEQFSLMELVPRGLPDGDSSVPESKVTALDYSTFDETKPIWENLSAANKSSVLQALKDTSLEASRQKEYLDRLLTAVIEQAPHVLKQVDNMQDSTSATDTTDGGESWC